MSEDINIAECHAVVVCVCVCPPSRLYHVLTARRIRLSGEGNALYPVLSSLYLCSFFIGQVTSRPRALTTFMYHLQRFMIPGLEKSRGFSLFKSLDCFNKSQ